MEVIKGVHLDATGALTDDVAEAIKSNVDINKHSTVRENLYEALRKAVIQGDIEDGAWISESWLAQELNVSRTPVRYALNRLADEGLLVSRPRMGVIVKGVSADDVREVFDIRERLEALATRTAMRRMDSSQFQELRTLLGHTEHCYERGQFDQAIDCIGEFDRFIYRASELPRLADIVLELEDYLRHFRLLALSRTERLSQAIQEHRRIYEAMSAGDERQVNDAVSDHLAHSERYLLSLMQARRTAARPGEAHQ
ncbi:citrate catabolism transcriptional regulator, GntR family [Bifidobacterium actinocoloniiforme DSM 22766]|uniref:Citrate catabolism transcriptional regulator, GntR family n=1 Tax=Bifidobacterium actinocoloniiforme DSM 22766 TaxID=1437605 RepID=A0A086YYN1_9BIFI|nr:GntR family transcriptional regulator [Bifidobacterium actinocoloniiforme]AKV55904.1 hypothetical protein AB656_06895 [Bifidobacterium actinocoloniiforme DSM 22766]KFI39381.1 citrate catabolism transcriptional regulator, GntR family [Bifidobacterium actinocoloniiforme DSM 22766]